MIRTTEIEVATRGHCDVHDLTAAVQEAVRASGIGEGTALVFVAGSTAGVTTVEFEPGLVKDLREFFDRLIPEGRDYHHHQTWGDDNGSSHLRAALLKPSLSLPIVGGEPVLGTWQQVVLVDFDTQARKRRVVLQVSGERSTRGFSLIECLAAIALLGLVLTSSFSVLTQKRVYLRNLTDRMHAQHAVEKEIETALAENHRGLTPRDDAPFLSDPSEVAYLPEVRTTLTIADTEVPKLRRLTARVTWGRKGEKSHAGQVLFCSEAR